MQEKKIFENIRVSNLTNLGSTVGSYLKTNDIRVKELLKRIIIEEVNTGNVSIDTSIYNKSPYNIVDFLSLGHEFDFVYETQGLKDFKGQKSESCSGALVAQNGQTYKKDGFYVKNNPLNSAIINNNEKFIEYFKDNIIVLNEQTLLDAAKLAINEKCFSFLNLLPSNINNTLKNYKNKFGQNICYMAYDLDTLDFIKNKFDLEPKSVEDWFSKLTYKKFINKSVYSTNYVEKEKENFAYIQLIHDLIDKGYNVEYYTLNLKKMTAPAIWMLMVEDKAQLKNIEPFLNPSVKDSIGNNFLSFYFNNLRKMAPEMNDSSTLDILETVLKSGKYDIFEKNSEDKSTVDMIKAIISKKTKGESLRLNKFKIFCEKISLTALIEENEKPRSRRTVKI